MNEDLQKIFREFKGEISILHLLDDEEFLLLSPYFELTCYPAGTTIIKEGESGDHVGIVVSGKLETKKRTKFGDHAIVLAQLTRGSLVAQGSVFEPDKPYPMTIEALEDAQLLTVSTAAFNEILQKYPATGVKLLKEVIRVVVIRMEDLVQRFSSLF